MTPTPSNRADDTVERVARALLNHDQRIHDHPETPLSAIEPDSADDYRASARAALSAIPLARVVEAHRIVSSALREVGEDIVSKRNQGAVVDTLWHSDIETTCDFIDTELARSAALLADLAPVLEEKE